MVPEPATPISPLLISARSAESACAVVSKRTHRDAVEDQRRLVLVAVEQHGAAAEAQLPMRRAVIGRLEMGKQRGSGSDPTALERRHHARGGSSPTRR